MKFSNLFKLILISIFITGIPSCEEDCLCCDVPGPYYFNAKIVTFELHRVYNQVSPENWKPYTGDTVNANGDLIIYLDSYHEEIAVKRTGVKGGLFTNTAYACSPALVPTTKQKLVSLSISSSEDYNLDYPEGSDLIDLFSTYGEGTELMPLSLHLATNPDYFILHAPSLFLNKNPDKVSAHEFKFELELTDTTFIFQTPPLILK